MVKQAAQQRIVAVVEDHEPGVYRKGPARVVHHPGVGVATHVVVALQQCHVIASIQQPGRRQPPNSAPDDPNRL